MMYLGDNCYWFKTETAFLEYVSVGGYKGAILNGRIFHRQGMEVWVKILPNT